MRDTRCRQTLALALTVIDNQPFKIKYTAVGKCNSQGRNSWGGGGAGGTRSPSFFGTKLLFFCYFSLLCSL